MADFTLSAQPRTVTGKKVGQLRESGLVPVIVYGTGVEPMPLQVAYRELEILLSKAGGTNLIDVNVVGGTTVSVLAREVQRHVVRGTILHVDFIATSGDTQVTVDVPVNFINESPAVRTGLGTLAVSSSTVSLTMAANNILNSIDADLSKLEAAGDTITVADLVVPARVTVNSGPDDVLARVAQSSGARAEAEAETAASVTEVGVVGEEADDAEADTDA